MIIKFADILLLQLVLIPRIEVTSIFSGSTPADYRKQDFDYYRCNDTFYDVSLRDINRRCEELFKMAGTLIHEGAARELKIKLKSKITFAGTFETLSYQEMKKFLLFTKNKISTSKKNMSMIYSLVMMTFVFLCLSSFNTCHGSDLERK
jgi:hypothetical protein